MAAKEKKETRDVIVPAVVAETQTITIEGIKPGLLLNRLAKVCAKGEKDERTPEQIVEDALYLLDPPREDTKYGVPVGAVKGAIVESAVHSSEHKNHLRGALFVLGGPDNLLPLHAKVEWLPTTMYARGRSGVIKVYRPLFETPWEITFDVEFNASSISIDRVFRAIEIAGFNVGIGAFRPQNNGVFGRFKLKR